MPRPPAYRSFVLAPLALVMALASSPAVSATGATGATVATDVAVATPASIDVDLRTLPIAPTWKPGDPTSGEGHRFEPKGLPPRAPAQPRRDPLLDRQSTAQAPSARAFTTPLANFAGLVSGALPMDTVGDVGPSHYIQMINSGGARFAVFDKATGATLSGPTRLGLLGSGSCASGLGDGIVIYDSLAGRWLLSEFSSGGNRLCVYVSKTGDPIAGGWWAYQFTALEFPDYPKYATWWNAYLVTTNESSPAVYALDRPRMLAGLTATAQRFTAAPLAGFSFNVLTAGDADATPPPIGSDVPLLRHRDDEEHSPGTADPGHDFLELYTLHVDFTAPANSFLSGPTAIPVAEFDSSFCGSDAAALSCIPQTTGTPLDAIREPIMNRLEYRNFLDHETLLGNFVTDVDGADRAGVRWFELRRTGGGPWTLFQEGTYSPDATRRWVGSIAMDRQGNVALGYSASSTSVAPSLRYAGRLAGDPPGALAQGEHSIQAGAGTTPSERWGDYGSMNVDPVDDCTFWFTSEYANNGGAATRIASFRFDGCAAPATSPGAYFTIAPCRALDTRSLAGGPLLSGAAATYLVAGTCRIPPTARAIAANVFVVSPSNAGFFTFYPGDAAPPVVSTINFGPGQTRANNAILPLTEDGNGALAVLPFVTGGGQAHVIVDVMGYFE